MHSKSRRAHPKNPKCTKTLGGILGKVIVLPRTPIWWVWACRLFPRTPPRFNPCASSLPCPAMLILYRRHCRASLGIRTSDDKLTSTARGALYRSGTPAHSVVHGSHDGGRPSDTSYPTVTTGRTVLQYDIALLRSRLSVSDTVQLTRPERGSTLTATGYTTATHRPNRLPVRDDTSQHSLSDKCRAQRHSLNSTCEL